MIRRILHAFLTGILEGLNESLRARRLRRQIREALAEEELLFREIQADELGIPVEWLEDTRKEKAKTWN